MTYRLYIVFILIFSLALKSCNNDDGFNEKLSGEYAGTFTFTSLSGESRSNPVTISFSGENDYQSSRNSDYIPAGGSGTYEKENSKITFTDLNIWTTNFDPNLILAGEYEYSLNGDSLMISAKRTVFGTYTYKLTKE